MSALAEGSHKVDLTFSRHYDELEDIMDFRLTYDGPLMKGGVDHKHEIRQVFHKQLKHLWETHAFLKRWTEPGTASVNPPSKQSQLEYLADNFKRGKYRYVPIATEERGVIVSLDILFLRSGQPGSIMKSADLDGRLKTLIDTLRMPAQNNEVGKYVDPNIDEDPFHCLMQDDNLVGNVSITTDALLQPTPNSKGYHDTHDSRIIIAVNLKTWGSSGLATVWV